MTNAWSVLLIAGCVALAAAGIWIIVAELRRVSRARLWPTVGGRVLASGWEAGAGESGSATYDVQVEYEYSLYGKAYKGSEHIIGALMDLAKARKKGKEMRGLYPVGRELPIAYNPERPEQSQLADEARRETNYGLVLLGLFFAGPWIVLGSCLVTGQIRP